MFNQVTLSPVSPSWARFGAQIVIFIEMLIGIGLMNRSSLASLATSASPNTQDTQPTTRLEFFDLCSRKNVLISTGSRVGVRIEIDHLEPKKPVFLDLTFRPVGVPPDHLTRGVIQFHQTASANSEGRLHFNHSVRLKSPSLSVRRRETIWNAQLTWHQKETALGGAHHRTIRVVNSKVDRLFQILSPALCSWETPVAIDSKYYFNSNQDSMAVQRDFITYQKTKNIKGPNIELWDHLISNGPFSEILGPHKAQYTYPWAFFWGTKTQVQIPTFQASQTWKLARGEGGYFGKRLSFERFRAVELRKVKSAHGFFSCREWSLGRMGYLDSGKVTIEFDLVPVGRPGLPNNPMQVPELMEERRPSLNTCDSKTLGEIQPRFKIPADQNGLLFFYPEPRIPQEVLN